MLRPLSPTVRQALEVATDRYEAELDGPAVDYLEKRGITLETARSFRLGVVGTPYQGHERMAGRLAIPYLGRSDAVSGLRFRALGTGDADRKYLGLAGVELRLYNVRDLHEAGDTIHISEGELDAISLKVAGLHAIGVPGVKSWKPHHSRLLAGFSRVYVWGDGDDPGREFAQRIAREIDSAIVVPVPDGDDVNSILVRDGPQAIAAMVA